jgi:hypothetical protein
MSSKSQNVATQNVVPATKSKGTLFGLSREQLKIVNGGTGVIITNPITDPNPELLIPGSTVFVPATAGSTATTVGADNVVAP